MPNAYIKKLADEGKGSVADLEKKWDKAKGLAADEGHDGEYDYITGVFKKMIGESFTDKECDKIAWNFFLESAMNPPYKISQILKTLQKRGFNMRTPKPGTLGGEIVWTFVHSQTNDQLDIHWYPEDDSIKYSYSGISKSGHGWTDVDDFQKTIDRVIKKEMMIEEGEPTQSVTSGNVAVHSSPTSIVRKRPTKMCECGSEHYKMVTDSKADPVWQCGCCGAVSERKTRMTAGKKKFRDLMNGLMPMDESKYVNIYTNDDPDSSKFIPDSKGRSKAPFIGNAGTKKFTMDLIGFENSAEKAFTEKNLKQKLKAGQIVCRYRTNSTVAGNIEPLILVNTKGGSVNFLSEAASSGETEDITFESGSTKLTYLNLNKSMSNNYIGSI